MSDVKDTVPPEVYPAGIVTLEAVIPSIVDDTSLLSGMEPMIFAPFTYAVFPSMMCAAKASASDVSA